MKDETKRIKPKSLESTTVSRDVEKEFIRQVTELVEPLCKVEGMELVHVEYQKEARGRVLRLYVDKPGGVTLNDCVYINRQIGDLLDVNVGYNGSYHLEVSSPGIDRPLGKRADFERFRGNIAKIRTSKPLNGRKNFQGVLSGISDEAVNLLIGDTTFAIPFQDITRARLVNYHGEHKCI